MRISDWSSDVCSSDLAEPMRPRGRREHIVEIDRERIIGQPDEAGEDDQKQQPDEPEAEILVRPSPHDTVTRGSKSGSSEERRVGKECVSTSRSRWAAVT